MTARAALTEKRRRRSSEQRVKEHEDASNRFREWLPWQAGSRGAHNGRARWESHCPCWNREGEWGGEQSQAGRRPRFSLRVRETEKKIKERAKWAGLSRSTGPVKRKERPCAEKATCCCDRQACRYEDGFPLHPLAGARKPVHLALPLIFVSVSRAPTVAVGRRAGTGMAFPLHPQAEARTAACLCSPPHSPSLFQQGQWLSQRTLSHPLAGAWKPVSEPEF